MGGTVLILPVHGKSESALSPHEHLLVLVRAVGVLCIAYSRQQSQNNTPTGQACGGVFKA
jgi:hypothetical protein